MILRSLRAAPSCSRGGALCTRLRPVHFQRPSSTAVPPPRKPIAVPTSPTPTPGAITYEPLERSIKSDRRGLLLFSIPIPPRLWPSHLDLMSDLLSDTTRLLKKSKIGVNAYYDGVGDVSPPKPGAEEQYPAVMIYPDGKRFHFPHFDASTLKSQQLQEAVNYTPPINPLVTPKDVFPSPPNFLPQARGFREKPEILVCTHGSRDCRCSSRGEPLVHALRAEIEKHKLDIPVREIGHVGGHKWAANALLVPSLDMLSNLSTSDAKSIVEHVANHRPRSSPMWWHWRGRIGLTEDEQAALWAKIEKHLPPRVDVSTDSTSVTPNTAPSVPLTFRTYEGEKRSVPARLGDSLLQVGKANDLPSLEGTCGGNLECATCHLYMPDSAPIPQPSEDELDMLGYAISYKDGESRLGCQIKVTPELAKWAADGGVIDLPRF